MKRTYPALLAVAAVSLPNSAHWPKSISTLLDQQFPRPVKRQHSLRILALQGGIPDAAPPRRTSAASFLLTRGFTYWAGFTPMSLSSRPRASAQVSIATLPRGNDSKKDAVRRSRRLRIETFCLNAAVAYEIKFKEIIRSGRMWRWRHVAFSEL